MQEHSYACAAHPRLRVHPSAEADRLKGALLEAPTRPADALRHVRAIAGILLARWAPPGATDGTVPTVPLFVLRGGLMLWQPWLDAFGPGPMGVLAPFRTKHEADPVVVYGSVPDALGARYALLDVALASGRTALAACRTLADRVGPRAVRIDVIVPFVADRGRDLLLERVPGAHIHCIWHDERVADDGRMVGPGFDIGEFALGNSGTSLRWAVGQES